ncbi:b160 [miniopterid betaherpesvirus 1]|uniref:B160 n=1 Tax=miniopterid betaherpesvirus 1 TaxID=3070189 RepID=I3VQG2_9BETA|nr:b160 [miniopterid betaherpesvirus 1]AFK84006.1 b160 [miniopterid betaherpesvirus 1]
MPGFPFPAPDASDAWSDSGSEFSFDPTTSDSWPEESEKRSEDQKSVTRQKPCGTRCKVALIVCVLFVACAAASSTLLWCVGWPGRDEATDDGSASARSALNSIFVSRNDSEYVLTASSPSTEVEPFTEPTPSMPSPTTATGRDRATPAPPTTTPAKKKVKTTKNRRRRPEPRRRNRRPTLAERI